MARPLRIQFPGAVYHITSRGNARQAVYLCDEDRQHFCRTLAQVIARYAWRCHAYCLMHNHYHLLIETLEATLARGMRQLNGVYTQHFNQTHHRVGHLWQGRYTAILVEKETHLLELCRYVVLNPVRAHLVSDPAAWLWSSYRAMLGTVTTPTWLTTAWVLKHFGSDRPTAQQRYRAFVLEGLTAPSPWEQLRGQIYLGSEQFCHASAPNVPRKETPRRQCQPVRPALDALFAAPTDRPGSVLTAYRAYGYRLREIAEYLQVHYTTVSRWLRAAEQDAATMTSTGLLDCKT